jgi:hypothetical protein
VLVAAVTAAARVVTPTVVPTAVPTVPTALIHQNKAIATAATARASSLRGVFGLAPAREDANMLFPIPLTLPFTPHICIFKQAVCDTFGYSAATDEVATDCIP